MMLSAMTPRPNQRVRCSFSPLFTFRTPTWHRDAPHSHRLDGPFILLTVKARVRSNHSWWSPELTLVLFDGGNQQPGILGTFSEHFVVRDDLVLGLLTLTRLRNSLGLLAFPLRMISVCGSKTLK